MWPCHPWVSTSGWFGPFSFMCCRLNQCFVSQFCFGVAKSLGQEKLQRVPGGCHVSSLSLLLFRQLDRSCI